MQHSDTITKIAPDFLAAQMEVEAATKDAANPFFKSKYADLNSVMEACKKALNSHGISVLQPVVEDKVETILMHSSGEWFGSETRIISKQPNDPQAQGSAITYARRYGLQSMVFIGAEDDDGEGAMARNQTPAQPERKPAVTQPVAGEQKCLKCGAPLVFNPRTGKMFCKEKCWLKPVPPVDETPYPVDEYDKSLDAAISG